MRLAILGATGPSGQLLVKEALAREHEVIALVRNPDKVTAKHDRLKVHKVDIFKPSELTPNLRGCDAVLSALGYPGFLFPFTSTTFYEDSFKSIVTAMREAKVYRFICITSWCTEYKPDNPKVIEWLIKPLLIGRHLKSMGVMERYMMEECSDINYTFVRPAQLTDGESAGTEIHAFEGQFVPKGNIAISRADVAKFMLNCLATDKWDRKPAAIAT